MYPVYVRCSVTVVTEPIGRGSKATQTAGSSLIMQRLHLEGARNFGTFLLVFACILLVISLAVIVAGGSIWTWLAVLVFVVLLIEGIRRVVAAQARIREFEKANGPDAGKQKPVT